MTPVLLSIARINARHLIRRPWNLTVALAGFAGVLFVLGLGLAVRQGLTDLAGADSGAARVIVFREGAQAEYMSQVGRSDVVRLLDNLRSAGIDAPASAESAVPVDVHERGNGEPGTVQMRGVSSASFRQAGARMARGHWFRSGSNEVVAGARAAAQFEELTPDARVRWGRQQWRVVGVLAQTGNADDNEVWGDLDAVQAAYGRGDSVQAVYFDYPPGADMAALRKIVNGGGESQLDVQRTRVFLDSQLQFIKQYVGSGLAWLSVFLAACVFLGTMSIMDSVLAPRMKQYKILAAIGFSWSSIQRIVALEGAAIAAVGGAAGLLALYLGVGDSRLSTVSGSSYVLFSLRLTWQASLLLVGAAALIGAAAAFGSVAIARGRAGASINSIVS
jgi:putative ABC transport system permease protein